MREGKVKVVHEIDDEAIRLQEDLDVLLEQVGEQKEEVENVTASYDQLMEACAEAKEVSRPVSMSLPMYFLTSPPSCRS